MAGARSLWILLKALALVLILSQEVEPRTRDVCSLPKVTGPCRAAFRKYYFNKATGKCERFIYGGCRGNGNNFRTKADCEKRCKKLEDVCSLPAVTGRCRALFRMYYFNKRTGKCERFVYGGCGGNGNRFRTKAACEKRCRPKRKCSRVMCMMYCKHGFENGPDGCPICKCRKCSRVMCMMYCKHGFQKGPDGCPICKCKAPVTPKCPLVKCMHCKHGYEKDANGCRTCKCKKPKCPSVRCMMYCKHGYEKDANGCQTCKCKKPKCRPLACRMYCKHGLQRDANGCDMCKCKKPKCRPVMCRMYCKHGWAKGPDGCEICKCKEPDKRNEQDDWLEEIIPSGSDWAGWGYPEHDEEDYWYGHGWF